MDTPFTTSPDEKLSKNRLSEIFQHWVDDGGHERFSIQQIQDEYDTLMTVVQELLIGYEGFERYQGEDDYQERKAEFESTRFEAIKAMVDSDAWYEIDEDNLGEDACNRVDFSFKPVRIVADFYGVDVGELP